MKMLMDTLAAVSMTVGRGPAARAVADLAAVAPPDTVVDVGCGPGAAVREAARRGATAIGVDPSPGALAIARGLTMTRQGRGSVSWREGSAEAIPVADASATVVWALSSAHHWPDPGAGIDEIRRVLRAGGRVLVCERLVKPGARGHAAHGFTEAQAAMLADRITAAGFVDARTDVHRLARRTLIVVSAIAPRE